MEFKFKKIVVLGAGAIGSVCGAFLSKTSDVILVGRQAHVDAIHSKGLSILGNLNGPFHLEADTKIRSIPEGALVLVATKANALVDAVKKTVGALRKDTVLLILQNGLGNEKIARSLVDDDVEVLRGVTTMAAELLRPGEVRYWSGETIIGQGKHAKEITEIFNKCGLNARVSEHIDRDVWVKLVVNCVVNPITAVLRVRNHAIAVDSLKVIRHKIIEECLCVARAEGVALPANLAMSIDEQIKGYSNFSSMYQDISRGRKTEIDFLNGKIVELGREHHVPTPVNQTLVSLVKFLEGQNGISRED